MKRIALTLLLLAAALAAFAQSSIQVDVHNIVGLDERFNVTFTIEGEHAPSGFEWAPTDDFQLVWGPQKGSSTSIRIVNGKTTKTSQTTYTYILMPRRTGSFTLPAANAKIKGNTITSGPFGVEVVENGQAAAQSGAAAPSGTGQGRGANRDGDIFLRFTLSRSSAVVGEPITATLKLYQRANIAGFEGARFPSFNGFWSQETEAPSNIEFRREQVGDKIYDSAVLRRYVLIPQQAGTLTIDPAELVCLVNVQKSASGGGSIFDSFFEDPYVTVRKRVTSAPATVRVSPLPAGAPASFGGGVGDFKLSAKFSKDGIQAHEAASWVVTLSGSGNVSLLEAPKLVLPPDFELYDTKAVQHTDKSGVSGSKSFEFPFIPRSHGDFVVGPVQYTYYSVKEGRYVTLSSDTLRLSVAKGVGGAASLPDGAGTLTVDRKGVRTLGEDVRFIRTAKPSFAGHSHRFFVGEPLYWILLLLLSLAAFAAWLLLRKAAARRADVAGTRHRKATKMALRRLRLSESFLKQNLYTAFYEELHKALLGFVSDKLMMDMAEQSKDNIAAALGERGVAPALVDEFTGLLDACEYARYAPDAGHEAMNAHYETAVRVISAIDSGMKKKISAGGAAILAALLLLAPVLSTAQESAYPDSLWNKGVAAYQAGLWTEAAAAWQGILDSGMVREDLYYNAGNAYFKAGDLPRAILNFERVLKLSPSDADARYNLELCNSLIQDKIDAVPEFVLKSAARSFSHSVPSNTWAALSIVFFVLLLGGVLLFLLGRHSLQRKLGFWGGIAALQLFFLCWDFASWQYRDYVHADGAIVMRAVAPVGSAPGAESSTALFVLHEGTKVRVLDSVDGWNKIELADGRQGWIAAGDLEMI